jgi:hypothetical protein
MPVMVTVSVIWTVWAGFTSAFSRRYTMKLLFVTERLSGIAIETRPFI